ncbi:MAG: hypothetical protein KGH61_05465 [Candidatus Micrarchaeota archaeon]|nr:hypothetical protein [Candidatus Micrarchaeota archaeon]
MNLLMSEKMRPSNLYRITKVKKIIEVVAYGSLVLDFGISAVTLVSINTHTANLSSVLQFLNVALTGVMVLTVILFLTVVFLSQYDKIIYGFERTGLSIRYRKRR